MSDDGLDDFFAKKDKSKKKSKGTKFTPSDIMPEQQDGQAGKKKKKTKKKEKENPAQSGDAVDGQEKADEEWNDYEVETEKDYSGLRIQNLQISKEEEEAGKDTGDDADGEEGENGERKEGAQGPWNKMSTPVQVQQEEPPPVVPKPEPEKPKEETPAKVGKYIPPSKRGMASSSEQTPPSHTHQQRRRKKEAPNIKSEEDFPTLGGGPPPGSEPQDYSSFERVRQGQRQGDNPTGQAPRLELGNKFDALSRGDGM